MSQRSPVRAGAGCPRATTGNSSQPLGATSLGTAGGVIRELCQSLLRQHPSVPVLSPGRPAEGPRTEPGTPGAGHLRHPQGRPPLPGPAGDGIRTPTHKALRKLVRAILSLTNSNGAAPETRRGFPVFLRDVEDSCPSTTSAANNEARLEIAARLRRSCRESDRQLRKAVPAVWQAVVLPEAPAAVLLVPAPSEGGPGCVVVG